MAGDNLLIARSEVPCRPSHIVYQAARAAAEQVGVEYGPAADGCPALVDLEEAEAADSFYTIPPNHPYFKTGYSRGEAGGAVFHMACIQYGLYSIWLAFHMAWIP